MPAARSRRQLLRSLSVASLLGVVGCVGDDSGASPSSSGTHPPTSGAPTPTPTPTATPPTETTYGPTSGPVETVSATPPGDPALDAVGEWPSYRFDSRNSGYAPDGSGLRDGEQYWRLDAGGVASVDDDTLFNLSAAGAETALTRREPSTAAIQSTTPLVEHGTNAPPTTAMDRVFVASFVAPFCLDAETGELLWRGPDMDGIQSVPTVSGERVFVNSGGFKTVSPHLRAFDFEGEELWRYETSTESKSTPAVADGTVFVAATDGLHAVDAGTGERTFVAGDAGARWSTPAVADGTVFVVADREGDVDALVAVDAASGEVRWRESTPLDVDGPPVVTGEEVYARTTDGVVVLDAASGEQRRAIGARGDPVAVRGDVLYVAGDGRVAAHDATSGDRLWAYTTESVQIYDTVGRAVYGVTPIDDAVYVAARDAFHALGPAGA